MIIHYDKEKNMLTIDGEGLKTILPDDRNNCIRVENCGIVNGLPIKLKVVNHYFEKEDKSNFWKIKEFIFNCFK